MCQFCKLHHACLNMFSIILQPSASLGPFAAFKHLHQALLAALPDYASAWMLKPVPMRLHMTCARRACCQCTSSRTFMTSAWVQRYKWLIMKAAMIDLICPKTSCNMNVLGQTAAAGVAGMRAQLNLGNDCRASFKRCALRKRTSTLQCMRYKQKA